MNHETDMTAHVRRQRAKDRARQRRANAHRDARTAAQGDTTPARVLRARIEAAEFVRDYSGGMAA